MNYLRNFRAFIGEEVWRLFLLASLAGLALFAVEASFVVVLQGFLLAMGLVPENRLMLPAWFPRNINGAMLLLIAFGFFRGLVTVAKTFLANRTTQAFMRVQRTRIMGYSLRRADETSVSAMVALFTERVSQVGGAFNSLSQAIVFTTSTILLIATAAFLAPGELLIGISLLILLLLPLRAFNRKISLAGEGLVREWERASQALVQGLRHHFFYKVYSQIEDAVARGEKSLQEYSAHFSRYYLYASFKTALPMMAGVLIVSVITLLSQRFIGTSAARLLSFFYIFIRIAQGGSELSAMLNELRVQYPSFLALRGFFERTRTASAVASEPATLSERSQFAERVARDGIQLALRDVSFSFSEQPLLTNISLNLRQGERLVIQGESGAGKSTLLALMLGLLSPRKGEILLNGIPVEKVRLELSPLLGYVGPEPFLIEGTVRENLLYGHHSPFGISDEALWDSLKKAQLAELVLGMKGGLGTALHELAQLSTGQKQRLAIARAILRNPRLLVLDEASANLDPQTEGALIESLRTLFNDCAVIVISHKDTFNAVATQLLRLLPPERIIPR